MDHTAALQSLQRKGREVQGEVSNLQGLQGALRAMAAVPELPYHIPVAGSKVAFFPGRLVETDDIMVLLGDSWFVRRTNAQAVEIASRREQYVKGRLEEIHCDTSKVEAMLQHVQQGPVPLQSDSKPVDEDADEYDAEGNLKPLPRDSRTAAQILDDFSQIEEELGGRDDVGEDELNAMMTRKNKKKREQHAPQVEASDPPVLPDFDNLVRATRERGTPSPVAPPRDTLVPDFDSLLRACAATTSTASKVPPAAPQAWTVPQVETSKSAMRPKVVFRTAQPTPPSS